jgi:hypothetical protein
VLHREEVQERHEAVRDAEPRRRQGHPRLPRRLTLAIPSQSNSRSQAIQWLSDFTSNASEKALEQKGNIPNATNLLGNKVNERAAVRSWFVPQAKHWVDVENGNILKTMLAQMLTGRLSVKQAATVASDNIAQTLNGS